MKHWQEDRVKALEVDVARLKEGHRLMSDSIDAMLAELRVNTGMTRDIQGILQNLRGFGRITVWVGKTMMLIGRYVVLPAALVAAVVYAMFHNGKMPEWWSEFFKFMIGGV